MSEDNNMSDEIVKAKIRRAVLSGPDGVTRPPSWKWMLDAR